MKTEWCPTFLPHLTAVPSFLCISWGKFSQWAVHSTIIRTHFIIVSHRGTSAATSAHRQHWMPKNLIAHSPYPPYSPNGLFVVGTGASLNSPNAFFIRFGLGFLPSLFHFQLNGAVARAFQLIWTCKQIHFDYFNICLLISAAAH